ncbi:MAG TPA: hypothetical protein VNX65_04435 [Patescibacteria group bacterium]|jgi:hypothetical protein|nr:hypothetical protein [Patescibacteria group bacterium]
MQGLKTQYDNPPSAPRIIKLQPAPAGMSSARYMAMRLYLVFRAMDIETRNSLTILVEADNPTSIMPAVRKYWLNYTKGLMRDRASTLDRSKIDILTREICQMQEMRFRVGQPIDECGVWFVETAINNLLRLESQSGFEPEVSSCPIDI